jgi:hypothetical protein
MALALLAATGVSIAQSTSEAERQYRIARRLAAEGSPEAAAALRKVVELDPTGPLADDGLIEEALLHGIPGWPRELGRLTTQAKDTADGPLARILDQLAGGDRAVEARYRRALLMLEPLPGRSPSTARVELLDAATAPGGGEWSRRARLALAWQHFEAGEAREARASLQRLVVDHPRTESADRALVWIAVLEMRESRFGEAGAMLQQAVDRRVDLGGETRALRELAVRGVLRAAGTGGKWSAGAASAMASTGMKNLADMIRLADQGVVVADRRRGLVMRLDADGKPVREWTVEDPQALAQDPFERIWVAAGDKVYLLVGDTPTERFTLGRFGPVSAMAVDAGGILWVADRKGEKIGTLAPGRPGPETIWEGRDGRARDLVWSGRRLLAVDDKRAIVFTIAPDGTSTMVVRGPLQKPVSMDVDPAGQIAVLDEKLDEIVLFGPGGAVLDRVTVGDAIVSKPVALGLGTDGSLAVFDGARGAVVRIP